MLAVASHAGMKLDSVGRSFLSSVQHAAAGGGTSALLQDLSKGLPFLIIPLSIIANYKFIILVQY